MDCCFRTTGFPFRHGGRATPCGVSYHTHCIRAGPPFRTRFEDGRGLTFPHIREWPLFICEGCTVRSVLDRELHSRVDYGLMALERLRILDIAHRWAPGTHRQYQQKLRFLREFQTRIPGLDFLTVDRPIRPPCGADIPLMWAAEVYSLRPGRFGDTSTFATIRGLRSALSQHKAIAALHSGRPCRLDTHNRVLFQEARSTDQLGTTLFTTGLSVRLGTETRPSTALLGRHVAAFDTFVQTQYRQAPVGSSVQRTWALVGLANTILWLGWLRGSEVFNLRWRDIRVTLPRNGPREDLPPNVGMIGLRLGPATKSSQSAAVDVVISFDSLSGLSCGRWLRRAQAADLPFGDIAQDPRYVFRHSDGRIWSSSFFRSCFLHPFLEHLQSTGDPFLRAFDDVAGNTIPDKFWSLHSYRRGS